MVTSSSDPTVELRQRPPPCSELTLWVSVEPVSTRLEDATYTPPPWETDTLESTSRSSAVRVQLYACSPPPVSPLSLPVISIVVMSTRAVPTYRPPPSPPATLLVTITSSNVVSGEL